MRKKIMSKNMGGNDKYMTACAMCGIGIGTTEFDSGEFEHIEEKGYKLYDKTVCGTCRDKYKGNKKLFDRKLEITKVDSYGTDI